MPGINFNPTAVEIIVRNNARLKRLHVALRDERAKPNSNEDRMKQISAEIKDKEKMAKDVEGALA